MKGFFISFEGGEGCGKGTQTQLLKTSLEQKGREVVLTREPGGTEVGERIRYLLKHDPSGHKLTSRTEALLFIASRAQNFEEVIAPALARGAVVLADRFIDSSVIYQGLVRGIGMEAVVQLNNFATQNTPPQLTFLLDVPVKLGFERVGRRPLAIQQQLDIKLEGATGEPLQDRIEEESEEFFERVRQGYLELAKKEPSRIIVIDASRPDPQIIAQEILEHVTHRMASLN